MAHIQFGEARPDKFENSNTFQQKSTEKLFRKIRKWPYLYARCNSSEIECGCSWRCAACGGLSYLGPWRFALMCVTRVIGRRRRAVGPWQCFATVCAFAFDNPLRFVPCVFKSNVRQDFSFVLNPPFWLSWLLFHSRAFFIIVFNEVCRSPTAIMGMLRVYSIVERVVED